MQREGERSRRKCACCLRLIPCVLLLALVADTSPAQQPRVPDDVELLRNIAFGKGGKQTLTMHVLRPRTLPREPMPVLVYVHGSAWMRDNKDLAIGRLSATAQQGYFGATIQVRTSSEAHFPAQLEDCKCAIRFSPGVVCAEVFLFEGPVRSRSATALPCTCSATLNAAAISPFFA